MRLPIVSDPIRVLEVRKGLDKDQSNRFRDALKATARNPQAACDIWQALDAEVPGQSSVVFNLALCAEQRGEFDDALVRYRQAQTLLPRERAINAAFDRIAARRAAEADYAAREARLSGDRPMSIKLTDFEKGSGVSTAIMPRRSSTLQERLSHAHARHIVHGHRAIIVFEGWDAAGKGGIIKRMTSEWDPRYFQVYPISAPSPEEKDRHFLWRFWQKLPGSREISRVRPLMVRPCAGRAGRRLLQRARLEARL